VNSRGVGAKGREEQEALKRGRRTGGEDKKKKNLTVRLRGHIYIKRGRIKRKGIVTSICFSFCGIMI
jgi:hypothetical protein